MEATTDRLSVSRVIAWGGADVGDVARFPARAVPRGAETSAFTPATAVAPVRPVAPPGERWQ
ncbi:hypothetical protein GCM10017691_07590 [Pseudonocardia petroleophila]|uniref:Uncharacterized protein n=1 Tax=Pseudonocardia petroleophila TaxID=37331 RepID=A0A7G7MJS0_9PSEU|nr:hypothetical protein [Pseudonocardia petroleophila]QNG53031.1 hypothetical protein H6H00_03045 [Pseudonocardia petroleophila]